MTDPVKPPPAADPFTLQDPCGEYSRSYAVLFQAWLVLFLAVICFALANYLYSYIPK
jgi:hypothetical protein